MLTRKFAALISITCLVVSMLWGSIGTSQASQSSISLVTDPPIATVYPRHDLVRLSLQAQDSQGQPLKDAKFHVQLLTPAKTPWFTTDFPIVEGTTLLNLEANAPNGGISFQQVFPIRGTYHLLVDVTPSSAQSFEPIQQTLTISVPENPVKYRNFLILAAILLAVGLVGGWVIGQRQPIRSGEIAPQRVRLLLSGAIVVAIVALLTVNISAEFAASHHHHHETAASASPIQQAQGLTLQLVGDSHATVGQLASLEVQATDAATGQPLNDVIFNVKAIQLEDNEPIWNYQGMPDATGKMTWQQQFFDGAPHRVEVVVAPQPSSPRQFQPFQASQDIEVDGIEPPMHTRLISLFYFTSIVVIGLLLSLGQQHWKKTRYRSQSYPNSL